MYSAYITSFLAIATYWIRLFFGDYNYTDTEFNLTAAYSQFEMRIQLAPWVQSALHVCDTRSYISNFLTI